MPARLRWPEFALLLSVSCVTARDDARSDHFPSRVALEPLAVLAKVGDVEVLQGGFGSAMAVLPSRDGRFFFLSDRGPNIELPTEDHKQFPVPTYAPSIGEYRWQGRSLTQVKQVPLRLPGGAPLSGLPAPGNQGATGEVAFALDGSELLADPNGVDPEGLVAHPDGTFWISEEYGPWLLHVASDGEVVERIGPFEASGRRLPAVLAKRRANRGMEGLALVPGADLLAGLMQSPLDNPKQAGRESRANRMLLWDMASGASRQVVYLLEAPENRITEIAALSPTRFLVIEIDGKIPGDLDDPCTLSRIFLVDVAEATDVSDALDRPRGRLFAGRTLEELDEGDFRAAGVRPVGKSLLVDLLDPAIDYPFDKPEGLVIVDPSTLALVNDDDFGIDSNGQGGIAVKRRPDGAAVRSEVWFLRLRTPLAGNP